MSPQNNHFKNLQLPILRTFTELNKTIRLKVWAVVSLIVLYQRIHLLNTVCICLIFFVDGSLDDFSEPVGLRINIEKIKVMH